MRYEKLIRKTHAKKLLAAIAAATALTALAPSCLAAEKTAVPVAERTIPARPNFPAALPGRVNETAIKNVNFRLTPAYHEPFQPAASPTTTILGRAEATEAQMAAYLLKQNPQPKITCSVKDLVHYYYTEGEREGIRGDIALAQAMKETGFFAYGGDVSPTQNNYCGLGATGSHEKGASFPSAEIGVRAHIQHLKAYASAERPKAAIVDPRYELVRKYRPDVFGHIPQWTKLNGVWAVPGTRYGEDILRLWQNAMAPTGSDASMRFAKKKLADHPNDARSYVYRGAVYYARGEYKKATGDFEKALKLNKHIPEAIYDIALTQEAQGDAAAARKTYERLFRESKSLSEAYYNAGLLEHAAKKDAKAREYFSAALRLVPQHANAMNAMAVVYIGEKKYADAWRSLQEAARINSANWNVLANQFIFEACLTQVGSNKNNR